MPEDPASNEHRTPAASPTPPQRNYGGCLLPIGIAVGIFGLTLFATLWKPHDMSPSEREQEIARFVSFMLLAIVLIALGVFLKKPS